jgi:DNA helicase-2/ATP-dependent DNA helicase PcrA
MDLLRAHGRLLSGGTPRILFPGPERLRKASFDGDWTIERGRLATEEGVYVFDLFAETAASLLSRARCIRSLVSDRYPIVILDEFQDTNDAQWRLVQHLTEESRVIALADPDQRIFEYDSSVDPNRLDHLRDYLHPKEFDFGTANHRSPDSGVLAYADAVLRNRPLPETPDVRVMYYYQSGFEKLVHAVVIWQLSQLRSAGCDSPTIAVLCRANSFVSVLSAILDGEHTYNGMALRPVDHHVLWDAELTAAAAQVVASILEWPAVGERTAVSETLEAVASFYDNKYAESPSKSALEAAARFRRARAAVESGEKTRVRAVTDLSDACSRKVQFVGDPPSDWMQARAILASTSGLSDIHTNVRFLRLFRAGDEIGSRLTDQWLNTGSYRDARNIVRRALDMRQVMDVQLEPSGVNLMTLHKSKGKEFDGVVIVEGAYRSKFFDDVHEFPPYEASRRLLRVGITRARRRVVLVRPQGALPLTVAS